MTFHLTVATPESVIYNDEVQSLKIPGTLGYMEILKNHAALITTLSSGTITIKTNTETLTYTISSGFFEVSHNQATLLIDL